MLKAFVKLMYISSWNPCWCLFASSWAEVTICPCITQCNPGTLWEKPEQNPRFECWLKHSAVTCVINQTEVHWEIDRRWWIRFFSEYILTGECGFFFVLSELNRLLTFFSFKYLISHSQQRKEDRFLHLLKKQS